jgi:hypothetical protein
MDTASIFRRLLAPSIYYAQPIDQQSKCIPWKTVESAGQRLDFLKVEAKTRYQALKFRKLY